MKLKHVVDSYMQKVSGLKEHCERCLRTERWSGSVILMVVDAAFTSIGLNYFTAVVPKVEEFNKRFVKSGKNEWVVCVSILSAKYRTIPQYQPSQNI